MNMWKNKQGISRGLKRLHVYDKKKNIEDDLTKWIAKDASRDKYADVVKNLRNSLKEISNTPQYQSAWYHNLGLYMSQRSKFALSTFFSVMVGECGVNENYIEDLKKAGEEHFAKYDQQTEKELFAALLQMEMDIPKEYAMTDLVEGIKKNGGVEKYTQKAFKESVFASKENFDKFMKKPTSKKLRKDPIAVVVLGIYNELEGEEVTTTGANEMFADAKQNFVQALREMNPNLVRYPDANFTMRMTYGTVLDYYPADAVHYDFVTTIDGIMEKEDPTNDEFIVPEKLKDLYQMKDYGQYADKNGNMIVCFLTNNDITGGNSGSPVINGKGELIGLAFDGNWEAMSGDIAFEPELQRTICVDSRYVLFIIDKFAGSKRLIEELKIVK